MWCYLRVWFAKKKKKILVRDMETSLQYLIIVKYPSLDRLVIWLFVNQWDYRFATRKDGYRQNDTLLFAIEEEMTFIPWWQLQNVILPFFLMDFGLLNHLFLCEMTILPLWSDWRHNSSVKGDLVEQESIFAPRSTCSLPSIAHIAPKCMRTIHPPNRGRKRRDRTEPRTEAARP